MPPPGSAGVIVPVGVESKVTVISVPGGTRVPSSMDCVLMRPRQALLSYTSTSPSLSSLSKASCRRSLMRLGTSTRSCGVSSSL